MAAVTEALVCSRVDGPYEVRQVVLGEMREDELLVRIVASGICHTDFACTNVKFYDPPLLRTIYLCL